MSSFAAGAGDDSVTITVSVSLMGSENPTAPFAYLRYYNDSKNHDPEYTATEAVPADAVQTASLSTKAGQRVTFLQPYYDFYSGVRVDMPDGSCMTIGANPRYGYVFDHWEGWETQAEEVEVYKYSDISNMPRRNQFTVKRDVQLTAVFVAVDTTIEYGIYVGGDFGDLGADIIGECDEITIDGKLYPHHAHCGQRVYFDYNCGYETGYFRNGLPHDDNQWHNAGTYIEGRSEGNRYSYHFYRWTGHEGYRTTDIIPNSIRSADVAAMYEPIVFEDPYERNTSFLMPAGNVRVDFELVCLDLKTKPNLQGDKPKPALLLNTAKEVYRIGEEFDVSSMQVTALLPDYSDVSEHGYGPISSFREMGYRNWGYTVDPNVDTYWMNYIFLHGSFMPEFSVLQAYDVTGAQVKEGDPQVTFSGFDSATPGKKTITATFKETVTGSTVVWVENDETATVTIRNAYGPSPQETQITVPVGAEIKADGSTLTVESAHIYKEYELEMEPQYRFKSWENIPEGGVVTEDVTVYVSCEEDLVPTWRFYTEDATKGQLICNFDLSEDALYTKRPGYNCTTDITVVADVSAKMNNFYAYSFDDPSYDAGCRQFIPIAEPGYVFTGWEVSEYTEGPSPGYECKANFEADTPASGATVSLYMDNHIKVDGQPDEKTPGEKIRVEFINADTSGNKLNEDYSLFCEWNQIGVFSDKVSSYDNFVWLEFEDIADSDNHAAYLTVPTRRIFCPYMPVGPVLYTPYSFSTDSIPENRAVEAGTAFDDTGLGSIHVNYRTRSNTDSLSFNFLKVKYKTVDYSPEELLIGPHTLSEGEYPNYSGQTCSSVETGDGNVKVGKYEYAVELPEYKEGDNAKPVGSIKENTRYFRGTAGMPVTFDMLGIDSEKMFIYVNTYPGKTAYHKGEDLDLSGLTIMTAYEVDKRDTPGEYGYEWLDTPPNCYMDVTEFCTFSELNSSTPGEKYIKAEFFGMSTYFSVMVLDDNDIELTVPGDSFCTSEVNYSGTFTVANEPADAEYILYRVDENGEKQIYSMITGRSFSIDGSRKLGTETYCIGAKFDRRWQYCSEPFSIVWTPYDISARKSGNTVTLTISDVEPELSVALAEYDEQGRFIGLDLSLEATAQGNRQLTLPDASAAETKLFFMKNWHSVSNGNISWNEIEY